MNADTTQPNIALSFTPEDLKTLAASGQPIPRFWQGHSVAPAQSDLLRFGPWQCFVSARTWEFEDSDRPTLRLYLSDLRARTDVPPA